MSDKRFYVRIRGKVTGPFGFPQLRSLRDRGQFRRFHEISEDRKAWVAAASLTDLFPSAEPGNDGDLSSQDGAENSNGGVSLAGEVEPRKDDSQKAEWHYIDTAEKQQGPVTEAELISLVQTGRIDDSAPVWRAGLPDWIPLSSVDALARQVRRPAASRQLAASDEMLLGWRRVRTGMTLALIAVSVFVAAWALCGVALLLAATSQVQSEWLAIALFIFLGAVAACAVPVLEAVALGFCANAPSQSGAKGWAIAAWSLSMINPVLSVVVLILFASAAELRLQIGEHGAGVLTEGMAGALNLVNLLLATAKGLLLLVFLRVLAGSLQNDGLAQRILYLLLLYGGATILTAVFALFYRAYSPPMDPQAARSAAVAIMVSVVLLLLLWLIWLVGYIVTLFQTRRAIGELLGK